MAIIFVLLLNQAFERYSLSARATALANAVTATATGAQAIRFNPAGLSFLTNKQFVGNYEWTLSGIEGLHNINLSVASPIASGGIGLCASEFGFSEQKEQAITVSYGGGFSKDFKFGIGTNLYCINNARMGYGWSYGIDISLLGRLHKKWSLGVYAHNCNQPQFGQYEEGRLSPELRAGIGYEPFSGIDSEMDISLDDRYLRIHMGGEFCIFKFFFIRTGIRTNPEIISGGIGIHQKFVRIDYGVEFEPDLPLNHTMSVVIEF